MGALVLNGHAACAALISGGSLPPEDQLPAHSETVLVVAIEGTQDFYPVQWAERGAPQDGPIRQDMATWDSRLKALQPIAVCDRVPGEQAPLPSLPGPGQEARGRRRQGQGLDSPRRRGRGGHRRCRAHRRAFRGYRVRGRYPVFHRPDGRHLPADPG